MLRGAPREHRTVSQYLRAYPGVLKPFKVPESARRRPRVPCVTLARRAGASSAHASQKPGQPATARAPKTNPCSSASYTYGALDAGTEVIEGGRSMYEGA